jgi:outer membrane protein
MTLFNAFSDRVGTSRVAALALPAAMLAFPSWSADLLEVYREARTYDATYASARAALAAGRERIPQGRALVLPTVAGTGASTINDSRIRQQTETGTHIINRDFRTNTFNVSLTQPLFRLQNVILYEQAGFQVAQSEAQFGQSGQDLILRVAQAYFDVLAAENTLAFIQAQKTAISEQLAMAKRNFEVGTATITDTNEAQARFDLSLSQEIAAQNDLEIRKRTLQQIIGRIPERLASLRTDFTPLPPSPNRMEDWVDAAQQHGFPVRIQEAAAEIAELEVQRNRAGHLPTLDLVATYGHNLNTGTLQTSSATNTRSATLGIQLALPIYSGGAVNSRVREALANRDRSRSDLENSRRQAALTASQSFLGVTNGMAQVRALEQAVASSETALASNRLGYEVGVRINIDVLNAQQQLFSTKRDLARARYDTLLNGLRLKAAAGTLGEEDVEAVNQLLEEEPASGAP